MENCSRHVVGSRRRGVQWLNAWNIDKCCYMRTALYLYYYYYQYYYEAQYFYLWREENLAIIQSIHLYTLNE